MKLPDTIKNPEKFLRSPSAGFDGVFDWSWTEGCFGGGSIKPMDFDGVVERRGEFLIMETKESGVSIPLGQKITLTRIHALGCFTVLLIWGKTTPETAEIWYPNSRKKQKFVGVKSIAGVVSRWYKWADA